MIPEAQCTVDRPDTGADSASNDGSDGSRGLIAPVCAFLSASHKALSLRGNRQRQETDQSDECDNAGFHFFLRQCGW